MNNFTCPSLWYLALSVQCFGYPPIPTGDTQNTRDSHRVRVICHETFSRNSVQCDYSVNGAATLNNPSYDAARFIGVRAPSAP